MEGGDNLKLIGRQKILEKIWGSVIEEKNASTSLYCVEKNRK